MQIPPKKGSKFMMKSAKKMRLAAAALTTAMCLGVTLPATVEAGAPKKSVPEITLDGDRYEGMAKLIDGITYVKIREFSESLGAEVTWNQNTQTAKVEKDGLSLTVGCSDGHFTANGYYLWFSGRSFVEGERIYVPLRAIGSVFCYDTNWDESSFAARLSTGDTSVPAPSYSEDDLYWLARIISAEAEGESLEGKLAVGTVVLNRVKNSEFPNTVYGVIFDRKNGVQFTPVANGEIYGEPDSESVLAARLCLEGNTVNDDILFFMNASLAESFWISQSRRYVMTVGNHDFYA